VQNINLCRRECAWHKQAQVSAPRLRQETPKMPKTKHVRANSRGLRLGDASLYALAVRAPPYVSEARGRVCLVGRFATSTAEPLCTTEAVQYSPQQQQGSIVMMVGPLASLTPDSVEWGCGNTCRMEQVCNSPVGGYDDSGLPKAAGRIPHPHRASIQQFVNVE